MGRKKKIDGHKWILQIFDADIEKREGLCRRSKKDVNDYASIAALKAEVKKREYHLIEVGDQYVVLCNKGKIIIHF